MTRTFTAQVLALLMVASILSPILSQQPAPEGKKTQQGPKEGNASANPDVAEALLTAEVDSVTISIDSNAEALYFSDAGLRAAVWAKMADKGSVKGMYLNAMYIYHSKYRTKENWKKIAVTQMEKAASEGYAPAQVALSEYYLSGYGVDKDEKKSFRLIQDAEKTLPDHPGVRLGLAKSYLDGIGTPRDVKKGYDILTKYAKDRKAPVAILHLGILLVQGNDAVARNPDRGIEYISDAAHAGCPSAMVILGQHLFENNNTAMGFLWQLKSAENYCVDGMFLVAVFYNGGIERLLPQDKKMAKMWLNRADEYGHKDAKKVLEKHFKE